MIKYLSNQRFIDTTLTKNQESKLTVTKGEGLTGEIAIPGDKSISHRTLILAAIADGMTSIDGLLRSDDVLHTLRALSALGVEVKEDSQGRIYIFGVGVDGLKKPNKTLYFGNSGTGIRLMTGLLSGLNFSVTLTGDQSLSTRPMNRIIIPLQEMGASIHTSTYDTIPLTIEASNLLKSKHFSLSISSAQVQTCLLLAGIYGKNITSVKTPTIVRDHTERLFEAFNYPIYVKGRTVGIYGGNRLHATHIRIPSDLSSAAFFIVAACITPNSNIILRKIGLNPSRLGVIKLLKKMGACIKISNQSYFGRECIGDIQVVSTPLYGINITQPWITLAIDELPILFIAAACAKGITTIHGASELRFKETDRLKMMGTGLELMGVQIKATEDGMIINGRTIFHSATVDSGGDHRVAMAFAVLGMKAKHTITILNCHNICTSFPDFISLAQKAGMQIIKEFMNE